MGSTQSTWGVSLEPDKMFKIIVASALVATAFAAGPPAYGAPAPYAPENLPPQPYAYEYGVADDYSKANFKKTETQDANGLVSGSFVIALPDGRIQTTTYTADHVNGFVADVTYEGTPVYPPEPMFLIIINQNFMFPRVTLRAPFWDPLECRQEKRTGLNSLVLRLRSPSSSSRQ